MESRATLIEIPRVCAEQLLPFHKILRQITLTTIVPCLPQNQYNWKALNSSQSGAENLVRTILLLTISNIFMTFAWYGHLRSALEGYPRQLGHRLFRILLPGAGQSHRLVRIHHRPTQNDSGSHHAHRLRNFLDDLSRRKLRWNYAAGFACICLAVFFVFHKW